MKPFAKLFAAGVAALALAPLAASAATLRPYDIDKEQTTLTRAGSFVEKYMYVLDGRDFDNNLADVAFALTELKLGSAIDINFGSESVPGVVFSRDFAGTSVLWSGTPTSGAWPADHLSVDTFRVDVPVFYLTITGNAIGTSINHGSYSFEITAMPAVPEPSSVALSLAGLGVLGWVASRRRRSV